MSHLWDVLWQTLYVQGAGLIIFLAGLSVGLGSQSVVLLVNRVTPIRFALNLLLSAAIYLAGALIWMASIWLIGRYVFATTIPFMQVVAAVSLAYVPLLYAALVLLPYIGPAIGVLLELWSLVIAVTAVGVAYQLPAWKALLCVVLGWLLLLLARFLLGRPAARLDHWLWMVTTGHPERLAVGQLPPLLIDAPPDEASTAEVRR